MLEALGRVIHKSIPLANPGFQSGCYNPLDNIIPSYSSTGMVAAPSQAGLVASGPSKLSNVFGLLHRFPKVDCSRLTFTMSSMSS
jgi:hypothetical protein